MLLINRILGVVYLIVAAYLLNSAFKLITLPAFIVAQEKWIYLIAVVILVIIGFKNFKKKESSSLTF